MKVLQIIKSLNAPDKSSKIMFSIVQAIIIYIIFIVLNQLFNLRCDGINLYALLMISITSGVLWILLEDKEVQIYEIKNINIIVGLIICLIFTFLGTKNFALGNITLVFIVNFICWIFSVKRYTFYSFLFTMKTFYIHSTILLIANILGNSNSSLKSHSFEISVCTIIYIVLSLYILYKLKLLKHPTTTQKHNRLDIVFILGVILITFLLSNFSRLLKYPLAALKFLYIKAIGILIFILTPILKFIINLYSHRNNAIYDESVSFGLLSEDTITNSNEIQYNALLDRKVPFAILVLLATILIIFCIIFFFKKARKKSVEFNMNSDQLFEDSREFILNKKYLKDRFSKMIGKIKNNLSTVYEKSSLNVNASISKRIRHEYRLFLQFLVARQILKQKINYTAKNIAAILCENYSSIEVNIEEITKIYEEVRYSRKEFTKSDFKHFQENVNLIKANILNS